MQIRPWVPPQEVTHSPINIEQASSTARGSRKRKEPSQASGASRSKRLCPPIAPLPSQPTLSQHHLAAQTCGAGPSTPVATATPSTSDRTHPDTIEAPSNDTLINTTPLRKATSVRDATDVYYFVRALQTDAVPTALPDEALERVIHDNPKSEWLGCKACK